MKIEEDYQVEVAKPRACKGVANRVSEQSSDSDRASDQATMTVRAIERQWASERHQVSDRVTAVGDQASRNEEREFSSEKSVN